MKCYLHIGTEKTATTTVQNFFRLNRLALKQFGFLYTKSLGSTNNVFLPCLAYDLGRRDDITQTYGIFSDSELELWQEQTHRALRQEVSSETSKNQISTIVFSSEHIQSRLTTPEELERLKSIILSLGVSETYVIVYLRRPADIACSLFSTAIKAGLVPDMPPMPTNAYFHNVCNHKATIQRFERAFGSAAVVPRLFRKDALTNGSIIKDIMAVTGIPGEASYEFPATSNPSLSKLGLDLLRKLNKLVPKWSDNTMNPLRADLVSYFERFFSGDRYVMPSWLYQAYDEEFADSDEWVRRNYFPNKDTLFSRAIPQPNSAAVDCPEIDPIAEFVAAIWNEKQAILAEGNQQ